MTQPYPDSQPKILRDYLAIDRTHLANQRTLLSYLRTGLYLLVSAVVVWRVELLQDLWYLGLAAVLAASLVVTTGLISYWRVKRRIDATYALSPKTQADPADDSATSISVLTD